MKEKESKKEKLKRLSETYQPVDCNLCRSKSYVIEEFLGGDEPSYLFKCTNKKCKNLFVLDLNTYIYSSYF